MGEENSRVEERERPTEVRVRKSVIQQFLGAYSVPCIVLVSRHTKMNKARGDGP